MPANAPVLKPRPRTAREGMRSALFASSSPAVSSAFDDPTPRRQKTPAEPEGGGDGGVGTAPPRSRAWLRASSELRLQRPVAELILMLARLCQLRVQTRNTTGSNRRRTIVAARLPTSTSLTPVESSCTFRSSRKTFAVFINSGKPTMVGTMPQSGRQVKPHRVPRRHTQRTATSTTCSSCETGEQSRKVGSRLHRLDRTWQFSSSDTTSRPTQLRYASAGRSGRKDPTSRSVCVCGLENSSLWPRHG